MAENVKVAVRVRPFNDREKQRKATLIIDMKGNSTYIKNPEDLKAEPRSFAFDYSYWSHDEFKESSSGYLEPTGSRYADQRRVFDDLGRGVLDNAWKGYNCSLFAYGQTGSGKSYSMVGYGNNKGIVPIFCEELFKGVEDKKATAGENEEYQVTLSMLEIYNEQVRDLLNPKSIAQKGGLKVRQHPSKGFYVESLVSCPVSSYNDIENRISEGTRNRTVAATNMNATSSRAHTIVAITFVQKTPNETGQSMTRTSVVNLVDLAGSERAESTGATGDRLKEGSAINQSLSTLGNVIKALADLSMGNKKTVVPYRDSVLTKLLQNALGGNSKTIMIAALSPADINFDETLSTLRFADRAKAIKTTATVNESPTDKLIRELREENARLMELLKSGGITLEQLQASGGAVGQNPNQEVEEMKKAMEEELRKNQEEIENMKKTWQERLSEQETANKGNVDAERKKQEEKKVIPHFWNLHEDPALTAMIVHFAREGTSKIGNKNASPPAEITISGLSIQKQHGVVTNKGGVVKIKSVDGKILVNGAKITKETELHHNDRVLFGPNHLYVFHHPQDEAKNVKEGKVTETPTYDTAQQEIAKKAGFMDKTGKSEDDLILQEDVIQMLPMVNEADAMSAELDKKVKFELALVSPQARGLKEGKTEVMVKIRNLESGNEWLWDRNKFINRKFLMQEMYQNYVEGADDWDVPREKDPFWEDADVEVLIGTVHVHLMSLSHKLDIEETLTVTNYQGKENGHIEIEVMPCTTKGGPLGEDDFLDDPKELVGKELNFKFKINFGRGLPSNMRQSCCKFKFYLDNQYSSTAFVDGMNPEYKFEKLFKFSKCTSELVDYLMDSVAVIEVWGKQKDSSQKGGATLGADTKQLMAREKSNLFGLSNYEEEQAKLKKLGDNKPVPVKKAAAKPADNNKDNGVIIPVPPPPAADKKQTDQQINTYKKQADDANQRAKAAEQRAANSESTVSDLRSLLNQKKRGGNDTITIAELEAMLGGGGRTSSSAAQKENMGDQASKACSIQ
ncbi:kinesin-like protein KIF28P [Crassostrea angulata]|uniref:kinesin-like protein KIF28P n=1 Tax=Magallana angulata TaxID=2784310 RepID=UPI0022B08CFC|nr:kinesin-like protein KIF28P [Crassostrea angulata]